MATFLLAERNIIRIRDQTVILIYCTCYPHYVIHTCHVYSTYSVSFEYMLEISIAFRAPFTPCIWSAHLRTAEKTCSKFTDGHKTNRRSEPLRYGRITKPTQPPALQHAPHDHRDYGMWMLKAEVASRQPVHSEDQCLVTWVFSLQYWKISWRHGNMEPSCFGFGLPMVTEVPFCASIGDNLARAIDTCRAETKGIGNPCQDLQGERKKPWKYCRKQTKSIINNLPR